MHHTLLVVTVKKWLWLWLELVDIYVSYRKNKTRVVLFWNILYIWQYSIKQFYSPGGSTSVGGGSCSSSSFSCGVKLPDASGRREFAFAHDQVRLTTPDQCTYHAVSVQAFWRTHPTDRSV